MKDKKIFNVKYDNKEGLWEHANLTIWAVEAILGAKIGNEDKSIVFIQDKGTKKEGEFYIDKMSEILYECIKTTDKTWCSLLYFKDYSLSSTRLRQNIASYNIVSSLGIRNTTFAGMDKNQACEKVINLMIKRAAQYTEGNYNGELLELTIPVKPTDNYIERAFELTIDYPGRLVFKYIDGDLFMYYWKNGNLGCSIAHYENPTGIFVGWKKQF